MAKSVYKKWLIAGGNTYRIKVRAARVEARIERRTRERERVDLVWRYL
jgi:hypothetical protein